MATATKAITNEDILEDLQTLMQMTSEGFDRLDAHMDRMGHRIDRLEQAVKSLDVRLTALERQYDLLDTKVDAIASEQQAQKNDIKEILDRLVALEDRLPSLSEAEVRRLQADMQTVVDWVSKVSKLKHINIKFPS